MAYRPPKGVRPPQLEGKRTGRPKGSKNFAAAWRDCQWGYVNYDVDDPPPTQGARLWQLFARCFPEEVRAWLTSRGQLQGKPPEFHDSLAAMRWVMRHDKEADTTALQRNCRCWMETDIKGFMRNLERLERKADW
jgi:hypothetical protein